MLLTRQRGTRDHWARSSCFQGETQGTQEVSQAFGQKVLVANFQPRRRPLFTHDPNERSDASTQKLQRSRRAQSADNSRVSRSASNVSSKRSRSEIPGDPFSPDTVA